MLQKLILQEMQLLPEFVQQEIFNFLLFTKSKYFGKTLEQVGKLKRPTFGCGSVNITMSADFDEPLDDFKDYM